MLITIHYDYMFFKVTLSLSFAIACATVTNNTS